MSRWNRRQQLVKGHVANPLVPVVLDARTCRREEHAPHVSRVDVNHSPPGPDRGRAAGRWRRPARASRPAAALDAADGCAPATTDLDQRAHDRPNHVAQEPVAFHLIRDQQRRAPRHRAATPNPGSTSDARTAIRARGRHARCRRCGRQRSRGCRTVSMPPAACADSCNGSATCQTNVALERAGNRGVAHQVSIRLAPWR